jgi:3-methylcrotonyl-CoA carboxylase alpha subunit
MRIVRGAPEFDAALASCRREAAASFGDDAVLVERYVQRPRHVEIQVFAETHGHAVYLFDRHCSVQRRQQKVLEEAPAPGMSEARRAEMGAAAVAAAKAVGYVGAGTVEFIAEPIDGLAADGSDGDLRFFFMEMNTRLQVEHPVTEAITGLDLVEWQLRVAAGEPLPLKQDELRIGGHAIEARICAENPDNDFLPATGSLHVARWPEHVAFGRNADAEPQHRPASVRIDAGVREGDAITPYYDSMIAKLIVWGETRAQAPARLDAALARTHIVGPSTNVAFLRRCAATRSFAAAELDTALIERERASLFAQPGLSLTHATAGVVAHALAIERSRQDADPWSRCDGWRVQGAARRRFELEFDGARHVAMLQRHHDGGMTLAMEGRTLPLQVRSVGLERHDVTLGDERFDLDVYAVGEHVVVFGATDSAQLREVDPLVHAGDHAGESGRLTAPMPGKLVALLAQTGDAVTKGQPLAVMEAMKMEHTIAAPRDGRIAELLYAVGDQVAEGEELLRLER